MKKHKRIIAFFLGILTVFLLIFSMAKDDAKVTTVRIWTADGQNKLLMTKKVDEFNENIGREKGIKIEYRVIRDNIDEKVLAAAKRGDTPEIFGGGGKASSALKKKGEVIPINSLPGGSEYLRRKVPNLIAPLADDGEERNVFGFQVRRITGGLIYNKDLFRKAGLVDKDGEPTPPESWEEFITYSKRIHECDSTKFGTAFPFAESELVPYGISWAVAASLPSSFEIDYKNRSARNIHVETIVNILRRLKKDGSCFPGLHTLNNDTLRHQFAQGNIGMFLACSWDVGVLREQFPAKCDWGVAPYPLLDREKRYSYPVAISGTMSISSSALRDEKTAEAVMEVYKWLYSDEMILSHYETEQWIPIDEDIMKQADESKMSEQWLAFCKQPKLTAEKKQTPALPGVNSDVYARAWKGEISFDEAVRIANLSATESLKKVLAEQGT